MDENEDGFDEEVEDFEEAEKTVKKKTETPKKKITAKEPEETTERYVAFYQEQKIGIVDTLTQELVIELNDLTIAKLEALKLNKLDKISIASGAQ